MVLKAPPRATAEAPPPRLALLGVGYVAEHLVTTLPAAFPSGVDVRGTTRDAAKAEKLRSVGITPIVLEEEGPGGPPSRDDVADLLERSTHWLVSAPPSAASGEDPFLASATRLSSSSAPQWVGYLSTTGVYGDTGGAWVDEHSPPNPDQPRTHRRLAAENAWLSLVESRGWPVHVFRLGGIYGPGRSALDRVRAGDTRRLVKPGKVFNRVHVDDIVRVLLASMARPRPGAVYNVVDGSPLPPEVVVVRACELLGVPPPPEEPYDEAAVSPALASFYAGNVRVRSVRVGLELGVEPLYGDAVAGLEALFAHPRSSP